MALCEVSLSDGSDLVVGEEMKIGMKFFIHCNTTQFQIHTRAVLAETKWTDPIFAKKCLPGASKGSNKLLAV